MHDLEGVGIHTGLPPGAQEGPRYVGQPELDLSFGDFLDVINPLQHIPFVANLYREITGDEISPHARILGDTLYGGPTGFITSIANVLYEGIAGEDVGETVIAFFSGEDAEAEPQFAAGEAPGEAPGETPGDAPADIWGEPGVVPAAASQGALPAPLVTAAGPAPESSKPQSSGPAAPSHGVPSGSAEAVLPEAGPGMLTGQDALNALFLDLRGSRQAPPSVPPAGAEPASIPLARPGKETAAKSFPLPPRHIRVAPPPAAPAAAPDAAPEATSDAAGAEETANPLLFAQEAGESALADRMMQALDKYQAMAQQRRAEPQQQDKPQWEADPVSAPAGGI